MEQVLKTVSVKVRKAGAESFEFKAAVGSSLREALLGQGESPYRGAFRQVNCKGMGICGSCRVGVYQNGELWMKRSCQIRCFQDMQIELQ